MAMDTTTEGAGPGGPLPTLRGIAYGCLSCGAMIDADTARQLYTDAFELWKSGRGSVQPPPCPECDTPGALVQVNVRLAPGVLEWEAERGRFEYRGRAAS